MCFVAVQDICDVNAMGLFHLHEAKPSMGKRFHVNYTTHIVFLHVQNLYKSRVLGNNSRYEARRAEDSSFFWPLKQKFEAMTSSENTSTLHDENVIENLRQTVQQRKLYSRKRVQAPFPS